MPRAGIPNAIIYLAQLASKTNRSKSFYLHELVISSLDRLEWEYSVAQRGVNIRAGRHKTVPLDEVERELELVLQSHLFLGFTAV